MDYNRKEIVRLAHDVLHNTVRGNFSMDEANDTLYKALVAANNGKDYLDIRDMRDGKCSELFAIIEEVISETKHDILTSDPFFTNYVEYKNYEFGDKPEFNIEDDGLFVVSEIGSGSQAIRRQRMLGGRKLTVDTSWKAIKVYEEIELLLAGRADMARTIDRVSRSFAADTIMRIYQAWGDAVSALAEPYSVTGSFDESKMVELIQHIKATNGTREAYIMGTLVALNKVVAAHDSNAQIALQSKYNTGISGMFNGTPKIELLQAYKPGTTDFALANDEVFVLPGGMSNKPIKYVTEGRSMILPRRFADNVDMTEEYTLMEKTGIAVVIPDGEGKFGHYKISG